MECISEVERIEEAGVNNSSKNKELIKRKKSKDAKSFQNP